MFERIEFSSERDPALIAAGTAARAEQAFLRLADNATDTQAVAMIALAGAQWDDAEMAFARATPTTAAGAIAKLRAIEGALSSRPGEDDGLELLHVRAVIRYLDRVW